MGITRKISNDPNMYFKPKCIDSVCNSGEVCGQGVIGKCGDQKDGERVGDEDLHHWKDCQIPAEDTRLSNPSCNLRGTGWNRWEWLCLNPQEKVEVPFDYNISNRIIVTARKGSRTDLEIMPPLFVHKSKTSKYSNSAKKILYEGKIIL